MSRVIQIEELNAALAGTEERRAALEAGRLTLPDGTPVLVRLDPVTDVLVCSPPPEAEFRWIYRIPRLP